MRLTLRTLLAGVDGVLEVEQQREFVERFTKSAVANRLAERIREGVGRADISSLRLDAWGELDDPNSVAEYLDNSLSAEKVEGFERTCLDSDVHLAEVGACHGMLAELLRTPAHEMPPAAESVALLKERMQRSLPTAPDQRGTIAASAAAEAIAAASRPRMGMRSPVKTARTTSSRVSHLMGRSTSGKTASSAGSTDDAAADRVSEDAESVSGGDSRRRTRVRRPARSAVKPTLGERLAAAGSVAAFVVAVGLIVTWANSPGVAAGPRRVACEGEVTFDGEPLDHGVVMLVPTGDTKGPAAGGTLVHGRFRIDAAAGPVVGRYRVEIKARRKTGRTSKPRFVVANRTEVDETKQFIPPRYNTDSELEVDVKPGRNTMKFDLVSSSDPDVAPARRGPQVRSVSTRPGFAPAAVAVPKRPG